MCRNRCRRYPRQEPTCPCDSQEIADSAIAAAKAGAAIAHIHVRDPDTAKGSRDVDLFRKTVDLIRDSDTDVVINLTSGMGGDWVPSDLIRPCPDPAQI